MFPNARNIQGLDYIRRLSRRNGLAKSLFSQIPSHLISIDGGRQSCDARAVKNESDAKRELKRDLISFLLMILVCGSIAGGFLVWKRKEDRRVCLLYIRNMQQAVRSYCGMHGLREGDPLDLANFVGPGKFMRNEPKCPAGGKYRFLGKIPLEGELALECSLCNSPYNHKPEKYSDW